MEYEHYKYKGYGCDADGTLYSTKGKRRIVIHHTGYQTTSVRRDRRTKQYRAHRFVVECVTGKPIPPGMVVNHLDGIKFNNAYSNLEICTLSENTQHAFAIGAMKPMVGEKNGNARITVDVVRNVIRDCAVNPSNIEVGLKYKLDPKHISLIRNKKRWKQVFLEDEFKDYQILSLKPRNNKVQRLSRKRVEPSGSKRFPLS